MDNKTCLAVENCKHGYVYRISSRNLGYGVFNQNTNGFTGIREKFSQKFLFEELHWDTGGCFGTAKPLQEIEKVPDDIPIHQEERHPLGSEWAVNPANGNVEPVFRKSWVNYSPEKETYVIDKSKEEKPHGKRQGFADYWAVGGVIGERLPDEVWPYWRGNKKLFEYLEKFENLETQPASVAGTPSNSDCPA